MEVSVSMTNEVFLFWYGQYRGIHQRGFQSINQRLFNLSLHPLRMWSSQIHKWCSGVNIASYKFAVVIGDAKELLNFFLGLRLRPLMNSCYFLMISADTLHRYNIPKIIYGAQAKGTLKSLSTEIVLLKLLKDPTKVLLMFRWGFTKNEDIIKVDHAVDIKIFM